MGREMDKYGNCAKMGNVCRPLISVLPMLHILHNIYVKVRTACEINGQQSSRSAVGRGGGAFVPLLYSLTLWKFSTLTYVNIIG